MGRLSQPDQIAIGIRGKAGQDRGAKTGLASIGVEALRSPVVPEATPEGLRPTLERAGFGGISITTLEAQHGYRDFDDYWQAQTPDFHPVGNRSPR
jgi:hypothetical protein